MCLGCGLFAGCVTQNAPDGPGDWSAPEWAGSFADEKFYYNLNFDNLASAFVTLFMLMIQNNWHGMLSVHCECLTGVYVIGCCMQ